jgi:hypothetical protein
LKVISTGVNCIDDLMKPSQGGRMDDQVAKDSCMNASLFGGALVFEVNANALHANGIRIKANTLHVLDGGRA